MLIDRLPIRFNLSRRGRSMRPFCNEKFVVNWTKRYLESLSAVALCPSKLESRKNNSHERIAPREIQTVNLHLQRRHVLYSNLVNSSWNWVTSRCSTETNVPQLRKISSLVFGYWRFSVLWYREHEIFLVRKIVNLSFEIHLKSWNFKIQGLRIFRIQDLVNTEILKLNVWILRLGSLEIFEF